VTVAPDLPGLVNDVGFGHRRSSLVIPRYGDCADPEGNAGDEICDVANKWGAEDRLDLRCLPRRTRPPASNSSRTYPARESPHEAGRSR
jgi:hypothetical protein